MDRRRGWHPVVGAATVVALVAVLLVTGPARPAVAAPQAGPPAAVAGDLEDAVAALEAQLNARAPGISTDVEVAEAATSSDGAAPVPEPVPAATTATVAACTSTWNGLIGDGRWESAGNWSPDDVPGPTSVACINGAHVTVGSGVTARVSGLEVGGAGSVTVPTGARLDVEGAAEVEGLVVEGGTLGGAGTVRVLGALNVARGPLADGLVGFQWTGGTLTGTGTLEVTASGGTSRNGALGEISGEATKTLDRPLVNGGDLTVSGTGRIVVSGPGITNTGVLDVTASVQVDDGLAEGRQPTLQDDGTLQVTSPATLTLDGLGLAGSGTVDVASGAELALAATTPTAATFDGSVGGGRLSSSGGALTLRSSVGVEALELSGTAFVEVPDTDGGARVGTLTVGGDASVVLDRFGAGVGSLTQTGGTVGGAADLAPSSWQWEGGTLAGPGTFTVPAGGIGRIIGDGVHTLARPLVNDDDLGWTGGRLVVADGGSITNDGTFAVSGADLDDGLTADHEPVLTNNGLLSVTTAGTTRLQGLSVASIGDVRVGDGSTLAVEAAAGSAVSGDVTGDGTVEVIGGELALTGAVDLSHLTVTGGTLTIDGSVAVTHVEQTGGVLTGSADLAPQGSWTWDGGRLAGTGTLTLPNGTAAVIAGAAHELARPLVNDDTLTWTAGDLSLLAGASITNDGFWTITADGRLDDGVRSGADPVVTNDGLITVASGTTTVQAVAIEGPGELAVAASATVSLGGAPSELADLTGGGALAVTSGAVDVDGRVQIGALRGRGGALTVAPSGGQRVIASRVDVSAGTVTLDGDRDTVGVGEVVLTGGRLTGSADLRPLTSWTWSGGTLAGTGRASVGSDITARLSGGTLARAFVNDGRVVQSGGRLVLAEGGSLVNDGTWDVTSSSVIDADDADEPPTFTNGADLTVVSETTLVLSGVALDNDGELTIADGSTVQAGAPLTNDFRIAIAEGGLLDLDDGYVQGAAARLTVRVRGADDVQRGRVVVSGGPANLDGELVVTTVTPFVAGSASLVVVDADARSGTFATVDATGWEVAYDDADVVIGPAGGGGPTTVVVPATVEVSEAVGTALVMVQGVGGTQSATVPVTVLGGTAAFPADRGAVPPTVTVAPGATVPLAIPIEQDDLDEDPETILLLVGTQPVTVTVQDDDATPFVRVAPGAIVVEGDSGPRDLVFTVGLSDALGASTTSGRNVTVVVSTTDDGTATAGTDFTADSRLVVIPAGEPSVTMAVAVRGDEVDEDDETVVVGLGSPTAAALDPTDRTGTGEIVDDDGPVVDVPVADEVNEGRLAVAGALPVWGSALDLPALGLPAFELPVVTDDLATALGTEDALAAAGAPFDEVDGELADVVAQLEAAGVTIDWAVAGAGGTPTPPTADDLLQARTTTTLADLAQAAGVDGLNDEDPSVLAGLAEALDLDGDLDLTGDLTLTLVFGVDVDGFYVAAESGLRLDLTAAGSVTGEVAVGGSDGVEVAGTGRADLAVTLTPGGGPDRLRAADLGADPFALLRPAVEGTAEADLDLTADPLALSWDLSAEVATDADGAVAVGTSASVDGTLDLPGFRLGTSPTATPARITFTGASTDEGWQLTGAATVAADLNADGFAVRSLTGSALVGPDVLDVTADLELALATMPDPTLVAATLAVDGAGWSGDATVERDHLQVGPVRVDGPRLGISADHVTATAATTIAVTVAADGLRVDGPAGPDGEPLVTVAGLSGSISRAGRLCLSADSVAGTIGEGLAFESDVAATDVEVCSSGTLLSVGEVEATLAQLDGLTVTITGLVLTDSGLFGAEAVAVEQPDGIAQAIGLAGLVPVDLTSLELRFDDHVDGEPVPDLTRFTVELVGVVDTDAFAGLPFDPVVQLGGDVITPDSPPGERTVRFSARVDGVDPLVVRPLDLGPITLGFTDLELGDYRLAGSITAEGFVDGELRSAVCGSAEVTGGFETFAAQVSADVCGELVDGPAGPEVDLTATITASLATREGIEVEDLALAFRVTAGFRDGAVVVGGSLESTSVGRVTIPFGEYATLQVTDAALDLSPLPGQPVLTVGGSLDEAGTGASLVFGPALAVLDGWGGRVWQVGLDEDFVPVALDGFFAQLEVPDDEQFGLPAFIPLFVDDVGFSLGDGGSIDPGTLLDADALEGLRVRFSGGLRGVPTFPVTASVEGLEVDLGRLLAFDPTAPIDLDTFPITNLAGVSFGIEPALRLGNVAVSGSLSFGAVEAHGTTVLYGRVRGDVSTPAFDAGADIVVSETGPVLLRVTAPVGVPLGPTGFVLKSVTGAATFGPEAVVESPREGHPEDLLTELFDLPTDAEVDADAIAAAVEPTIPADPGAPRTYTWDQGFAIALEGNLTHVASAGMLEGRVTVAAAFGGGDGVKLVGRGAMSAFGIPLSEGIEVGGDLAVGGLLLDFTEPLAPSLDLAFESPVAGSPLAVVFPAQALVAAQVRTDGVVEGVGAGLATFVDEAVSGGVDVGGDLFAAALADLAADLQARRTTALARLVLPPDDPRTITATLLRTRLIALLSDPATAGPVVGPLVTAVGSSLADAVADGSFGTSLADAAAALYDVVGDAAVAALRDAGARFDPSFTFTGRLQPLLLGIPVGSPTTEVTVALDRTSLRFEAEVSVIESLKAASRQLPGIGVFAEQLITLSTLGGRDTLTFGVQVPMPGLTDVLLLGGELPALDPADAGQGWSIVIGGAYELHGLRAEVSGFLTAPGNDAFIEEKVERRYLSDPTVPPDRDRIQVTRQQDYDNLLRYGGLVLDGRLEVPRLLTDPVDVLADLPPLPSDAAGIVEWLTTGADVITQTETPVRLTAFVPGMAEVLADPTEATARRWAESLVVTGVFEGTPAAEGQPPVAKLLSLPVGEGRLLATSRGMEVTAEVPLLGLRGRFDLRVEERDGTIVPAGGVDLTMTSGQAQAALRDLGLPAVFAVDASARFRGYTPGFDPDSSDLLERRGGLSFGATLDAEGFVEDAGVSVAVDPVGTGFGPDFTATATVAKVGPLGGVEVRDATLAITKAGRSVTVHLEGEATIAGTDVTVAGDLAPDLTGTLTVTAGQTPTIGGVRFTQGGFSLTLVRGDKGLVAQVGLSGTVELPAFLAARSATPTVSAVGCLGSDGAVDLRLGLAGFRLDPAGTTTLTGSGAALPVDPSAPCTLPPGTPPLPASSARILVRTLPGGPTRVVVDGAVRVAASDLPLLSVTGSLTTDGTGSLTVRLGGDTGLSLSGFRVRGTAVLVLDKGTFSLDVNGSITVPGVVTDATVDGFITSTGIQRLSVTATGLSLTPLVVRSSTLAIVGLGGGGYRFEMDLSVEVPGLRPSATGSPAAFRVVGNVTTTGDFRLRASGSGFTVGGVGLTSVVLDVTRTGSTFGATLNARFGFWGTTLEVEGSVTVVSGGISGRLRLSLPNTADGTEPALVVGGWGLGGTFEMTFAVQGSPASVRARVMLTSGTLTVPGVGTLEARADMATDGTGSIALSTTGIRLGGADSPFVAGGSLFVGRNADGVVTLRGTGVHVRHQPAGSTNETFRLSAPDFAVSSDGSFGFSTLGGTIGDPSGLRVVVPPAAFSAEGRGLKVKLVVGAGSLFVPGLADGSTGRPALGTPAITIDLIRPFSYVIFESRAVDLGFMTLNGKLVLSRSASGTIRLAIERTAAGPASLTVGGLGTLTLGDFFVDTAGDFAVTASTRSLGPSTPRFQIQNASFTFRRRNGVVELSVPQSLLSIPALSQPIVLPALSFRTTTSFSLPIDLPTLDLGPFFHVDDAHFTLSVNETAASLRLNGTTGADSSDPDLTLIDDSVTLTLRHLEVSTAGTFTGIVRGSVRVFGHPIASATMDVSLVGGVVQVKLDASDDAGIDLGFIEADVSGTIRSNGVFSFTGSVGTSGEIPGVSWDGDLDVTVANTGISGSFDGGVNIVGLLRGRAEGEMSAEGEVTGTLSVDVNLNGRFADFFVGNVRIEEVLDFAFDVSPDVRSPDTTKPTFTGLNDRNVAVAQQSGEVPIYYTQPTADDSRDGTVPASCNPGSGSAFPVGEATRVTCTARDAAGNVRIGFFTITVQYSQAAAFLAGNTVIADLGGFGPATGASAVVMTTPPDFGGRSTAVAAADEPVENPSDTLATVTADAAGVAHYEVELPTGLTPGPGQLAVYGVDGSGAERVWAVPLVVGADGRVERLLVDGPVPPPVDPPVVVPPAVDPPTIAPAGHSGPGAAGPSSSSGPVAALPRTGSDLVAPLRTAVVLLVLGAALLLLTRARRRRPTTPHLF